MKKIEPLGTLTFGDLLDDKVVAFHAKWRETDTDKKPPEAVVALQIANAVYAGRYSTDNAFPALCALETEFEGEWRRYPEYLLLHLLRYPAFTLELMAKARKLVLKYGPVHEVLALRSMAGTLDESVSDADLILEVRRREKGGKKVSDTEIAKTRLRWVKAHNRRIGQKQAKSVR